MTVLISACIYAHLFYSLITRCSMYVYVYRTISDTRFKYDEFLETNIRTRIKSLYKFSDRTHEDVL